MLSLSDSFVMAISICGQVFYFLLCSAVSGRFASTVRSVITATSHIIVVLLTQYCAGDKIEKNEMGGACGTYGGRGVYKVLVGKPEGKRPLGRPRRRWEDNIKMDL